MSHVSNKAIVGQNIPREVLGEVSRTLLDASAGATDEVDVVGMVGQVVARRPVVEVGVSHDLQGLQRLERPIDRGRRQRRTPVGGDSCHHLVRRRMPEGCHGVEHALTLGGHPAALGTEPLADVLHHPTVRFVPEEAAGFSTLCW